MLVIKVFVNVLNVSPDEVVVEPLPFPIIIWLEMLLIFACFSDNVASNPEIWEVAKLGICDVVHILELTSVLILAT